MTQKEIKELQERCYAIGNSKFPLDAFFNDIRDNPNPNFNKESAYEDLKLIVDEIYRLREEKTPKKPRVEKVLWAKNSTSEQYIENHYCPECGEPLNKFKNNYCNKCGIKIDWSEKEC